MEGPRVFAGRRRYAAKARWVSIDGEHGVISWRARQTNFLCLIYCFDRQCRPHTRDDLAFATRSLERRLESSRAPNGQVYRHPTSQLLRRFSYLDVSAWYAKNQRYHSFSMRAEATRRPIPIGTRSNPLVQPIPAIDSKTIAASRTTGYAYMSWPIYFVHSSDNRSACFSTSWIALS